MAVNAENLGPGVVLLFLARTQPPPAPPAPTPHPPGGFAENYVKSLT